MTPEQVRKYTSNGVFQAIIDGKPLQYSLEGGPWTDFEGDPLLDAHNVDFRVKPNLNVPMLRRAGDVLNGDLDWDAAIVVHTDGKVSYQFIEDIDDDATILVWKD